MIYRFSSDYFNTIFMYKGAKSRWIIILHKAVNRRMPGCLSKNPASQAKVHNRKIDGKPFHEQWSEAEADAGCDHPPYILGFFESEACTQDCCQDDDKAYQSKDLRGKAGGDAADALRDGKADDDGEQDNLNKEFQDPNDNVNYSHHDFLSSCSM